ncbi:MAG: hypothetical protein BroJett003_21770 [Planctomycetota bacterium]|nr:MAG: hypothetical protein BroJett003_21770 [Planctomycetota bacterium]
MFADHRIAVIIPALNEEQSLPHVLAVIPGWVDDVIVVDNGSSDTTARLAAEHGARVVSEPCRGYGAACLAGIAASSAAEILVFLDADFSDHPEQMERLVVPIARGEADLVIGSRTLGNRERGALTIAQRWGNALACFLIRCLWGQRYTDLGPFRAIRASALHELRMDDRNYGWTIQMQIRALQAGLRVHETPVDYRRRIGESKISGTMRGIVGAGSKILTTVFRERLRAPHVQSFRIAPEHLIAFSRYPEPGKTKTRLIPALGAEGAAELQREMTMHTLLTVEQTRFARRATAEVRFVGGTVQRMSELFETSLPLLPQGDGDLGARMHRALADAFARGAGSAIVIGTDCPSLDAAVLDSAFEALQTHDCVLGPAHDGGYYLIGLRRPAPQLFNGIDWGSECVLRQTLAQAAVAGLSVHQLAPREDVDLPANLPAWRRSRRPNLSVIIPTLNEAGTVQEAIECALQAESVEVLVADGGSTDETWRIATEAGARVIHAPAGRAAQMNAGAAAARGQFLLFLHADTTLPIGYAAEVMRMLAAPRVVLGAFRLGIDHSRPVFRLIEWGSNVRSRLLRMPYGDQALCTRASDFYRLGGFADLPFMEDFEFVRRVRRRGRVAIARCAVRTSARRWLARGLVRLTLIHQACIMGYRLGFAPAALARWRDGQNLPQTAPQIERVDINENARSLPTSEPTKHGVQALRPSSGIAETAYGR